MFCLGDRVRISMAESPMNGELGTIKYIDSWGGRVCYGVLPDSSELLCLFFRHELKRVG